MAPVRIVTDSAVCLPPGFVEAHGIRVAPVCIQFGQETYREGIDLSRADFFRRIAEGTVFPQTSQPTPASFAEIYRELASEQAEILVITITGRGSGTYQSAVQAKEMVPEANVAIFDSLSVAFGHGYPVMTAVKLAEAGQRRVDILAALQPLAGMKGFLTPAELTYLQRSGRVSLFQNALASILNIKPVIAIRDGTLILQERVRTRAGAVKRLVELIAADVDGAPVVLGVHHVAALADAEGLAAQLQAALSVRELYITELPVSLAIHGGPGIIGAVYHKWVG